MRPQGGNGEVRLTDEDLTQQFRDYAGVVYFVGLSILHDPDQAEDVVGEVFLRLARSRKLANASKGYFETAARNEALHIVGRSHRWDKFAAVLRAMQEDEDPGPENELTRSEQSHLLRRLIRQLPDRCRRVHELTVKGLTQTEISDRLGISPNAVQKQASRGYRLLAKMARELDIRPCDGVVRKSGRGGEK